MAKVKHIALIKFKEGTSEEQIGKLFDDILDMTETIPGIDDYVAGPNCCPDGLSQGYTHGFIMTFADAAARNAYATHPDLTRVKGIIRPHIEPILLFDFEI